MTEEKQELKELQELVDTVIEGFEEVAKKIVQIVDDFADAWERGWKDD